MNSDQRDPAVLVGQGHERLRGLINVTSKAQEAFAGAEAVLSDLMDSPEIADAPVQVAEASDAIQQLVKIDAVLLEGFEEQDVEQLPPSCDVKQAAQGALQQLGELWATVQDVMLSAQKTLRDIHAAGDNWDLFVARRRNRHSAGWPSVRLPTAQQHGMVSSHIAMPYNLLRSCMWCLLFLLTNLPTAAPHSLLQTSKGTPPGTAPAAPTANTQPLPGPAALHSCGTHSPPQLPTHSLCHLPHCNRKLTASATRPTATPNSQPLPPTALHPQYHVRVHSPCRPPLQGQAPSPTPCALCRYHNQTTAGCTPLLALPPEVLSKVLRHAGKDTRLVCAKWCHLYGSPGKGVQVPTTCSATEAIVCARLAGWPAPHEVQAVRHAATASLAVTQQLLSSFPGIKRLTFQCSESVNNGTFHSQAQAWQQSHDLLTPLRSLTKLEISSATNGAVFGTQMWGPISQLPELQVLSLDAPITMRAPLPTCAVPMPKLRYLRLSCGGGGLLQERAPEVFRLFPRTLHLSFANLLDNCTANATDPEHLKQALANARCTSLEVALLCLGLNPDLSVPTAQALAGATPHLTALYLESAANTTAVTTAALAPAFQRPTPIRVLHLRLEYCSTDPAALLSGIAPGLPNLEQLRIDQTRSIPPPPHADGSGLPLLPTFAHSLPRLQHLELVGLRTIESLLVPHLAELPALMSLQLQLDSWPLGCLPHACTALVALTQLQLLHLPTIRMRAAGTEPGGAAQAVQQEHVAPVVCVLGWVRQMAGLRELHVVSTSCRMTPEEASQLLPLPRDLKKVKITCADLGQGLGGLVDPGAWEASVRGALEAHVPQLVVQLHDCRDAALWQCRVQPVAMP